MATLNNIPPWGKFNNADGAIHHLAHHCADVTACFEALVRLPFIADRLSVAAGGTLDAVVCTRLAVLAFLHDVGKLHPGFQAKGWAKGIWRGPLHGHVREGAAIFSADFPPTIAQALCLDDLLAWGIDQSDLFAALAHHGRPFRPDTKAESDWRPVQTPLGFYDPVAAASEIGAMMRPWFPAAFAGGVALLPEAAGFWHIFCGLVTLADWIGSDRNFFPYVGALDPNYIDKARVRAARAIETVGIDTVGLSHHIAACSDFSCVAGFSPNAQQKMVGDCDLDERLVILEAETGSGKTEAALWRFAQLFEAGKVGGLYFALPTRAAAVQLHGRVNRALHRMFGDDAPEAVLAVPGYMKAGEAKGYALPDWQVRWDDDADEATIASRWAAESAKRYLAATVAVGTVDQAMLASLQVRHAHMRVATLSRSLLVIDEVHASDSYMTEVQNHLLRTHLGWGGYAMLMSATLGSVARTKWLGRKKTPDYETAVAAPYPALWGTHRTVPGNVPLQARQKSVAMTLCLTMDADQAASIAIGKARLGGRVLVIRNTVETAVATWRAVQDTGGSELLMQVADGPALHHGRFAPEDRTLLDRAVEAALSPQECHDKGVIVIGTQTLEQSLDIDADFLLTDLCPVDVLLQRIGRLHRHIRHRPAGFEIPCCAVMVPDDGLAKLTAPAFENGLGGWVENGVLNGIYRNLSCLELTRRLMEAHQVWTIPAMNRMLVEAATHPDVIAKLNTELGPAWSHYYDAVYGKDVADAGAARNVALPVDQPFADVLFVGDEETIRTRLGEDGARIRFTEEVAGPFGQKISGVTLPAHWSRGMSGSEAVPVSMTADGVVFEVEGVFFQYNRCGLLKRGVSLLNHDR